MIWIPLFSLIVGIIYAVPFWFGSDDEYSRTCLILSGVWIAATAIMLYVNSVT